jgi:hypothetical protein
VHAVDKDLIPIGPDIQGHDLVNGLTVDALAGPLNVITQHVIDILNTPVTNSGAFGQILP